tara:strand:- start:1678 stop:2568 length:891 start_codon:yes stop_codon:yes gene_type:complete
MTNGILMFALNGQAVDSDKNKINIDYVRMAIANAKNIKKYMKHNSVALVTDQKGKQQLEQTDDILKYIDHVIVTKPVYEGVGPETNPHVNKRSMRVGSKTITFEWQNQSRPDSYKLSPYDKTILLDCDYFVYDNSLDSLFDTDANILCGKHVEEISYKDSLIDYERLHHQTIKLFWATVLYFTKSEESKLMFRMMDAVKKNWRYYSKLYKFEGSRTYRNDFAVSVALHLMQGKQETTEYDLPLKILCLADKNMMPNAKQVIYRYNDKWAGTGFPKQNIHVMNKESAMKIAGEILDG